MMFLNGYVKNIHTAEELTEDTFFKLVVKKPKYKGLIVIRYYLALQGTENGVTVMVTPFFCVQG